MACIVLFFTLSRTVLGLNAVADHDPLYITLSDGNVRNTFTLRVLNKKYPRRTFNISVQGIDSMQVNQLEAENKSEPKITAPPDDTGAARVAVNISPSALAKLLKGGNHPVHLPHRRHYRRKYCHT